MSNLGNQPAFPRPVGHAEKRYRAAEPFYNTDQKGMTIRQHYAGLALQGLLADPVDREGERRVLAEPKGDIPAVRETCAQAVARLAVEYADALLAELEKTSP